MDDNSHSRNSESEEVMHVNGMALMKDFVKKYELQKATVLDMGSLDINGSYRELFDKGSYIGVDIVAGKNVDVIVGSPEWDAIQDVDAVISGQTLEHVADIPEFMANIYEKLKPGGLICIIAPSAGPRHDVPIWVGHFDIERMSDAVRESGFEIVECITSNVPIFFDTRCIARKPEE
jgi:SAM-dependent methyltransferase